MIIVTGGAGFIGSNFVLDWLGHTDEPLINVDKLTYAGNLDNLSSLRDDPRHVFAKLDIADSDAVMELLTRSRPRAILNFAAESHVDRSIKSPREFMHTNIMGTFTLLDCARQYWNTLPESERRAFRFVHVSTDEVYGSLSADDPAFSETTPYAPNSPYSASKAASDHLVRAYFHTYGLPTLTTNCSNNYGPYQYPEKLMPLMIHRALSGQTLPIYGDGGNVRDWLYVQDHCSALRLVLQRGTPGEVYNIGGENERTNLEVVRRICATLDFICPRADGGLYEDQMVFVEDRHGHDRRYAIDATKLRRELGWTPKETFESGLVKTVRWYLDSQEWLERLRADEYRNWIAQQYA